MILLPGLLVTSSLFITSRRTIVKVSMKAATTMLTGNRGTVDASSTLEDLLLHVKTLSPVNQRAISAVVSVT